ncbi:unnamed protein product, partial [Coregonus sp. 'balchen']
MPFAAKTSLIFAKKQVKRNAWIPLNHQLSNNNVFEERSNLLGKWWSDSQRKAVLRDFFSQCSTGQLKSLHHNLTKRVSEENLDFTPVLPRVLSLYFFSFLDPRSLCRCAQTDCCADDHVELHIGKPKTPSQQEFILPEVTSINTVTFDQSESIVREVQSAPPVQREMGDGGTTRGSGGSQLKGLPPWRGADRYPTDTVQFNYLENLDPIEYDVRPLPLVVFWSRAAEPFPPPVGHTEPGVPCHQGSSQEPVSVEPIKRWDTTWSGEVSGAQAQSGRTEGINEDTQDHT